MAVIRSLISRTRGRVEGLPRRCWCRQKSELKLSKSEHNPNRRFFRCSFVAANRLKDDKHVFKWMDDAILSKIEIMDSKMVSLHQDIITSRLELEKRQREFESDILERVESVLMVVLLIVVVVVRFISFKILA